MNTMTTLNTRAYELCDQLIGRADELRLAIHDDGVGVPVVDCGVHATGSIEAGLAVAEICLAGRANVQLGSDRFGDLQLPAINVWTDHPVSACLGSQFAGWKISDGDFHAMASGPIRAAAAREDLFGRLGHIEDPTVAVGVLECSELPPPSVGQRIAEACDVEHRKLTLLVASTASLVGTIQVVARSVETALHKLFELEFDVKTLVSATGSCPLPTAGGDNLTAMGRTNDAVLYGSRVTLWARCEDAAIESVYERVPSCASRDFGRPFAEIFAAYHHDFYQIDPHLFSPAQVAIINLNSGRAFRAGAVHPDVLRQSIL